MNAFTYETVVSRMSRFDGVRIVALNRPESLNAMNRQLIRDVAAAFDEANGDPATRAIIFTGEGRAFCAGDDRKAHVHPASQEEARALVDDIQQATRAIVFGAKPVVGAIWGKSAKGFFPEVSLNLFVTGAVTTLLPAIVGLSKAREMLMLGERHSAAALHTMGLAHKVVDDDIVMDEAEKLALKLAQLPPLSLRAMKRVLNRAALDLNTALELETEATVAGFLDPETTRLLRDF